MESSFHEIRVLLVDDETSILELSKTFLEREEKRLKVETTTSAVDALKLLENKDFDVLVSDYQMPVMDGLAFLEVLRDQGNNIPFIMFTGKGREEVAIKALNLGADRYIQKGGDNLSQYSLLIQAIINEVSKRRAEVALKRSKTEREQILNSLVEHVVYQDLD